MKKRKWKIASVEHIRKNSYRVTIQEHITDDEGNVTFGRSFSRLYYDLPGEGKKLKKAFRKEIAESRTKEGNIGKVKAKLETHLKDLED